MSTGLFLALFVTAFACAAFPPLLIPVGIVGLVLLAGRRRH